MALIVSLRSVVALVGRFPVLAETDLDVAQGEVVLVRGPNGAGKTSLLRVCAGLVAVESGQATVLGHDLRHDRRAVRGQVGLLGHSSFLYDDLTAEENVRFMARAGARASGAPGVAADVMPVLGRLGLSGRLGRVPAGRLSAGQRRRVAIAALVVRRPRLWLLDEPHAGLDTDGRQALHELVADAVGGGATVVFTSHEGDEASALADRVVTMAGGRAQVPAPSEPRAPVHVA